jgi:MoxR-like ATPase
MNIAYTLTPGQLTDFLLNVATVRPVFIWSAPGIGKSSLVQDRNSSKIISATS